MPQTKSKIVNNGLPLGIFVKALTAGHIVDTRWDDAPELLRVVITEAMDQDRPVNWKGVATYKGISASGALYWFDATQVVDVQRVKLSWLMDQIPVQSALSTKPVAPSGDLTDPVFYVHTKKAIRQGHPADRLFVVVGKGPTGELIAWKCQMLQNGRVWHPGYKDPMPLSAASKWMIRDKSSTAAEPTALFKPDSFYEPLTMEELEERLLKNI